MGVISVNCWKLFGFRSWFDVIQGMSENQALKSLKRWAGSSKCPIAVWRSMCKGPVSPRSQALEKKAMIKLVSSAKRRWTETDGKMLGSPGGQTSIAGWYERGVQLLRWRSQARWRDTEKQWRSSRRWYWGALRRLQGKNIARWVRLDVEDLRGDVRVFGTRRRSRVGASRSEVLCRLSNAFSLRLIVAWC